MVGWHLLANGQQLKSKIYRDDVEDREATQHAVSEF